MLKEKAAQNIITTLLSSQVEAEKRHRQQECLYLLCALDLQLRVQSVVQRRLLQDYLDLVLAVLRQTLTRQRG